MPNINIRLPSSVSWLLWRQQSLQAIFLPLTLSEVKRSTPFGDMEVSVRSRSTQRLVKIRKRVRGTPKFHALTLHSGLVLHVRGKIASIVMCRHRLVRRKRQNVDGARSLY